MFVNRLRLYNFRNFREATVNPSPKVNILFGLNGQGKTNFIEALSVVASGRSFRCSRVSELVSWGQKEASVFAGVSSHSSEIELGVAINGARRYGYVNGEKVATLSEYVGRLVCISFSPSDLETVKGAPAGRRRFFDRHLIDMHPELLQHIYSYNKALRSKNRLLATRSSDRAAIDSWNTLLAQSAVPIYRGRAIFAAKLVERANDVYQRFAKDDGELALRWKTGLRVDPARVEYEQVYEYLSAGTDQEQRAGTSVLGPHREDVEICLGGHDSRAFASQGQSRSIVLALKLGVTELYEQENGEPPVILLDDVDSELDRERSSKLFEMLLTGERQLFITGTSAALEEFCADRERAVMRVEHGQILFQQ